jgi:hypothetical protein
MSMSRDSKIHGQIGRYGAALRRSILTTTALIAPFAGAALCAWGSTAARAQSSNIYSGYTDTVTLSSFLSPLKRPSQTDGGNAPSLNVTFRPGTANQTMTPVTMDTGSTGMIIGSKFIDVTGLQSQGPGSIKYTSDNLVLSGTFYNVPFSVSGKDNATRAGGTVKVLVVPNTDVQMMGIGYDRGGNLGVNPVFPGTDMNAFLNISQVNGTPTTSFRTGYVITKDGVSA